MAEPPAFLCDGMLGHVCRWLRLLGFDAEYAGSGLSDDEILLRLAGGGRTLATRDADLHRRAVRRGTPCVLLPGGPLDAELEALLRAAAAPVERARWFTRCTHCNRPLTDARRDEIAHRVPPAVLAAGHAFSLCTGCGHVYWAGTHVAEIERRLRLLQGRLSPRPA